MTLRRAAAGPSVVALHGFTGTPEDWLPVVDGWDLTAPWLPGHGVEPRRRCSMEAAVKQVLTEMPAQPWVFGYSMGARAALSLAVAAPHRVRGLVLVGGTPGLEGEERSARIRADEALAERIEREGLAAFLAYWRTVPVLASQDQIEPRWRDPMRTRKERHTTAGLAASLRGMGTGAMPPLWEALPKLTVPTLLVTGERDVRFTELNARMARLLPHAEHVVLEGVGHTAHLEAPEAFRAAVRAFWQSSGAGIR